MSVALIAGEGALPETIAARLAAEGNKPFVYALREDSGAFSPNAREVLPLFRVELKSTLVDMTSRGVRKVIFAGVAPKALIYRPEMLDGMALEFLAGLGARDDHSLLGGLVTLVEKAGFEVIGYRDLLSDMLAPRGLIAGRPPSASETEDIGYGVEIAGKVLPLSFGQSVVVSRKSVVAVEAMEGTDAAILRAGSLCGGGVVVKMMKRGQDARYDIPVVGPGTLRSMAEAGLSCLAVQADWTLILSPDEFRRTAIEGKMSITGVDY
ncbi:MAG: UDP-2,3-diacylglucosamine diphosphatase LpxI [Synergistaceae bacterium]|jgi:DUF1009 family protein|nr:UDP-2,3-diacylglucosamine diphosphatase LpxI [Synergistaceae bacterium]